MKGKRKGILSIASVAFLALSLILFSANAYALTGEEYYIDEASNGYISEKMAEDGITVVGSPGYLVGTSETGPFSEMKFMYPGTDTLYVADDQETLVGSTDEYYNIDSTAPVVTSVQTTSPSSSVNIRNHGIYSNTDAEIVLTVTAEDTESGMKGISLHARDSSDHITEYESIEESHSGDSYTASFLIEDSSDLIKSILYVSAKDRVGNKSELTLIENTESGSTIVIEHAAPSINDAVLTGEKKNGWFPEVPKITASIADPGSGISSVKILMGDNEEVFSKEFEDKQTEYSLDTFVGGKTEKAAEKYIRDHQNDNNGKFSMTLIVTDNCGNISSESLDAYIALDAPVVQITGISDGSYVKKAEGITVKSNDTHADSENHSISVEVKKNGTKVFGNTVSGESAYKIPDNIFEGDGKYTITASAEGISGIKAETKELEFTKDSTDPELSIPEIDKAVNSYGWVNEPVTFSFDTSDETAGLKAIRTMINGEPVESDFVSGNTYKVNLTAALIESLIDNTGKYVLTVSVEDKAGNIVTKDKTIKADIVAPELTITGMEEGSYNQKADDVILRSDDANADKEGNRYVIEIKRNGNEIVNKTVLNDEAYRITADKFSKDGAYIIKAKTIDPADNESENKTLKFVKDSTKPSTAFDRITGGIKNDNGWYNRPIRFHFDASDETAGIDTVACTINDKPVEYVRENGEYVVYLTKELIASLINDSGSYTLNVKVTDKAGNASTIRHSEKVDIVTPVLTIDGIEKGKHYQSAPTLNISTNEKFYNKQGAYITVTVYRDDMNVFSKVYTGTNAFSFSSFAKDGDYTVKVEEKDAADNNADPRTISFVKDGTAPRINISGVTEGKFYNHTVHPTVTVSERYYKTMDVDVKVTRKLHGKVTHPAFPFDPTGSETSRSIVLSDTGEYNIEVTAKDEAGNVADSREVSFKVDAKAPEVTIQGVGEDAIYGYDDIVAPEIIFKDDYLASSNVSLTRAGKLWYDNLDKSIEKGKIAFYNFKKKKKNDGLYVLTVTVKDKANNTTTKTVTFSVNRYGSTFKYLDDVKEYNNGYFKNVNDNLHIEEFNVNTIKSTKNIIKLDGETISETGAYKKIGNKSGFKQFEHTFDSGEMEKEGVYTINVISKDEAGNVTESSEEAGDVRIVVDRTKPSISVDGFKKQVKGKSMTFTVNTVDHLSPVDTKVVLNGSKIKAKEKNVYTIPEGINQEVVITATDKAGNTSSKTERVTVTTNGILYAAMMYWPVAAVGLAAALAALAFALIKMKSHKPKHAK